MGGVEKAGTGLSTAAAEAAEAAPRAAEKAAVEAANLEPEAMGPPAAAPKPVPLGKDGRYDLKALSDLRQDDSLPETAGDLARCSAQGTVAALLARGKDATLAGIKGARTEIEARITRAGGSPEARAAWAGQLAHLDAIEKKVRDDKLDTHDVNRLASTLYQIFDSSKSDDLMTYPDIEKMQKAVGLAPEATFNYSGQNVVGNVASRMVSGTETIVGSDLDQTKFAAEKKKVANECFGNIANGETASVGVFNPKDPTTTSTNKPNHIVLIGKSKTGEPYCYDSLATPSYYSGAAAKDHLAKKIGVSFETPSTSGGVRTYPLKAAAPMIVHPKTT